MEVKFSICEEVVFLNSATGKLESGQIKGVQVVPTGISKDEEGNDVLEGYTVLYQLKDGGFLTEGECYESVEAAKEGWKKIIETL